ncbi:glycosyltransferase family 4 protein [Vibrio alfacsensis]|uniref:glycosyltransferase family 4 protein n=1 Tax=Vibrio alfacsensis TaxID=1074311 RepID=UPI004067E7AA
MKKIICIGPIPEPTTGQSLAFKSFVRNSRHSVKVVDVNLTGKNTFIKVGYALSKIFEFLLLLIKFDFDVMYITTSRSNLGFILDSIFVLLFSIFKRKKIINHLHGSDFLSFRDSSPIKKFVDFVYSKIDTSIVLCQRMKEQYANYPRMHLVAISNFSSSVISPSKIEPKLNTFKSGNIKIIYLSNLMYSKGVVDLLEAVSTLNEEGYDIELKLAGKFLSDEYCSKEKLKVKVLSFLSDKIHYVGVVRGGEKEDLLSNANVFCLPTFYKTEAQPISIIESMSYHNLSLTTNHNYNGDFLTGDDAIFFDKRNIPSLMKLLKDICNNPADYCRIMEHGYQTATTRFTLDGYVRSIDELIEK